MIRMKILKANTGQVYFTDELNRVEDLPSEIINDLRNKESIPNLSIIART